MGGHYFLGSYPAGVATHDEPTGVARRHRCNTPRLSADPSVARVCPGLEVKAIGGWWRSAAQRLYGKLLRLSYSLAGRVGRLSTGKLFGLLAVCVVLIYPFDGILYKFYHDSSRSGGIVEVLSQVAWRVYNLIQVSLIVLLAVATYNYVANRR
jgi:hypothetical protein